MRNIIAIIIAIAVALPLNASHSYALRPMATTDQEGILSTEEILSADTTHLENLITIAEQELSRHFTLHITSDMEIGEKARWFLPYTYMDDIFLLELIKKCFLASTPQTNCPFDKEQIKAIEKTICLIVDSKKDKVTIKTFGVGRRCDEIKNVVNTIINFSTKSNKKIHIDIVAFDINAKVLKESPLRLKKFVDNLPEPWRGQTTYNFFYGDITNEKCWGPMIYIIRSHINVWRNTWVIRGGKISAYKAADFAKQIEYALNVPGMLIIQEALGENTYCKENRIVTDSPKDTGIKVEYIASFFIESPIQNMINSAA
ncbi:MAG: hypothetical protein V2A72_00435 [Candidatus Omnitrophota bacterium]